MPTIQINHVSKAFGKTRAVDDVSFEVEKGEIFGLLGPNGAGKTTMIRVMLDIFKPDQGEVYLYGNTINENIKKRIGYLPEERGLYKDLQLEPTLIYLATLKGLDASTARTNLQQWLRQFDLIEHKSKKIQELSRGMQQKAQIIATLVHDPDLIIVDEPFSGLDPVNTRLVKDILNEERRKGKTIIMSTHQMHQVEAMCDRIVLIDKGQVVLYGQVDEIKRNFAGNAILIEAQGEINDLPGVLETRRQNSEWQLTLERGVDPQSVFRALAAEPNIKIERFEIAEPSLEDIFISVVQGRREGLSHA